MPSDAPASPLLNQNDPPVTGRCYCGAVHLTGHTGPQTVAYCHCADCRRWTGAPVAAFAAFAHSDFSASPELGQPTFQSTHVQRWSCAKCGSPLAARFDYLPGQTYVPLGLLDQAGDLPPALHCHAESRLCWLDIADDLPRTIGTARDALAASSISGTSA